MKEVKVYTNGTYNESEIKQLDFKTIKTIGDYEIIRTNEQFVGKCEWPDSWSGGDLRKIFEPGQHFVIGWGDGVAYPFDTPFYEADEDEGIKEQLYPETPDDVLGLVESFGR